MIELLYFTIFITILNIIFSYKKTNVFGCGLVGFSGKDPFNIQVIRTLLWHNSLTRGKHATGIYTPSMGIIKSTKEAKEFFKEDKINLLEENDNVLMGHVRQATVGNKEDINSAHPWDFGSIVMMHNGTLTNFKDLAKQYNLNEKEWTVDSQVLGLALKDNFDKKIPFKALSEYQGAAAVVLYHKERKSLFVYRDTQRELNYGYVNGNLYISSLSDILEIIGCENIKSFDPYKVYEIKDGEMNIRCSIKRNKAEKNTIIKKLVTSKDQIKTAFNHHETRNMLLGDFTGFSKDVISSELVKGFYLEAICNTNSELIAAVTKGKSYKVVTVKDKSKFTITDDNNVLKEASIHLFNFENFIPIKGSYVVPLYEISGLQKEELYEVLHYVYGIDTIVLRDHINNRNLLTNIINVRKATEQEVDEYFKEPGVSEISTDIKFLVEKNEVVEAEIIEDDEPVDVKEIIIGNLSIALSLIKEELKSILDENNDLEKTNELLFNRINESNLFIENCLDSKSDFILNINENSFKNLEHA